MALLRDGHKVTQKTQVHYASTILAKYQPEPCPSDGRAGPAWGLDTGLVFTTYRMSSISWAVLALGLAGVTPWWAGLGYAAGFLVPLTLGCTAAPLMPGADGTIAIASALTTRASVARVACVCALVLVAVGLSLR